MYALLIHVVIIDTDVNFTMRCSHCSILCWYLKWTRLRYLRYVWNTGTRWCRICIVKAHLLLQWIHYSSENQSNFHLVASFIIQYSPRLVCWSLGIFTFNCWVKFKMINIV